MSCYDNVLSQGGWGAGKCNENGHGPHDVMFCHKCHGMSCYDNIMSQVGEVRASVMDTVMDHMMDLDTLDTGEEADNGDDMDEMNMPNPGKWGY